MSRTLFGRTILPIIAVCVLLPVATARAQTAATEAIPNNPVLTDRFVLELGGFYSRSSTQAALAPSTGGVGVVVDFENTLGLEERNLSAIAGFLWRMTERWRLEVDYFSLNRNATRTLGSDVTWGDQTFTAGTTVNSSYDFYDVRVSAGYSFFKRRDKELGVGIGVHVAGIKATVQAGGTTAQTADVLAPLPVLSLFGLFALTDEWAMRVRADWLSLNYDVYSGDLRSSAIEVLYNPFRNVGLGVGFRTLVLDVEISDTSWRGRARTSFTGPSAFMTVVF